MLGRTTPDSWVWDGATKLSCTRIRHWENPSVLHWDLHGAPAETRMTQELTVTYRTGEDCKSMGQSGTQIWQKEIWQISSPLSHGEKLNSKNINKNTDIFELNAVSQHMKLLVRKLHLWLPCSNMNTCVLKSIFPIWYT